MIVVQLRRPYAQRDIEKAALLIIVKVDGAEGSRQRLPFIIGNRIVQVVRRRIGLLFEDAEIALQFVAEDIQQ